MRLRWVPSPEKHKAASSFRQPHSPPLHLSFSSTSISDSCTIGLLLPRLHPSSPYLPDLSIIKTRARDTASLRSILNFLQLPKDGHSFPITSLLPVSLQLPRSAAAYSGVVCHLASSPYYCLSAFLLNPKPILNNDQNWRAIGINECCIPR